MALSKDQKDLLKHVKEMKKKMDVIDDKIGNCYFPTYPPYYTRSRDVCPGCGKCNHCGRLTEPDYQPYKIYWGTTTIGDNTGNDSFTITSTTNTASNTVGWTSSVM